MLNDDTEELGGWRKRLENWKHGRYLLTLIVLYTILLLMFVALLFVRVKIGTRQYGFGWAFLALVTGYTLAGLKTVGPNLKGLILRFGNPILDTGRGLKLVPLGICTLRTVTQTRIQLELPGEPEQIWRMENEKGKELPPGIGPDGKQVEGTKRVVEGTEVTLPWVTPWRITTASREGCLAVVPYPAFRALEPEKPDHDNVVAHDNWEREHELWEKRKRIYSDAKANYAKREQEYKSEEEKFKNDPLHVRLTVESQVIIRFRVADFRQFIQVIHTVEEAKRQIEDTVAGRVQIEFARRTPALILAHLGAINRHLLEDVEVLVGERIDVLTGEKRDPWGIRVEDVYVKLLGITESVNKQIAARAAAGFTRRELEELGTGRGEAKKKEYENEAEGLEKVRKVVAKKGGVATLAAKTTETTFGPAPTGTIPQSKTVVVGSELTGALASAAVATKEALRDS